MPALSSVLTVPSDALKRRILGTLKRKRYHMRQTAAALGIDPKTLRRYLRKYGLGPAKAGRKPPKKRPSR